MAGLIPSKITRTPKDVPVEEDVSVEGVKQAALLPEIPKELANWVAALK